jgi:CheY-like chemotaxis protein
MMSNHCFAPRENRPSRVSPTGGAARVAPVGKAETIADRVVLIVEDDATQRDLLAELFAKNGHSVATAATGGAALAMLWAGLDAWLVVIDLAMPAMSGEAFCAALHLDPQMDDLRVVLYSARGDLEEVACRLGVPFVAKPNAADLLLYAAHRW